MLVSKLPFILLCLVSSAVAAQDSSSNDGDDKERIEQLLVIGKQETVPGSGNILGEAELDRFDYSDINLAIAAVPGVYVREEEGFGLRPNIGIRGAAAERSLKITLMEDGVLIAPAPYSAPAAYYVPNISRISGIEVLKGPSAIESGPHTVGGAINLVTREIPNSRIRELDLSYGTNAYYKAAIATGGPVGDVNTSYLFEALSYGSDGFKMIDAGDCKTGFVRNDVSLKFLWAPDSPREHRITLKLAYANEDANETYLGLTDRDFRNNPLRRYRASQLARFQSNHYNIHMNYGFVVSDVYVNSKIYWNQFDRSWNKLDGFIRGRSLQSILTAPHLFINEYQILVGSANSLATDDQTLEVTNNDRSFTSSGIQMSASKSGTWGEINHDFTLGLRFHQDEVMRDHQPVGYLMSQGILEFDGQDRPKKSFNQAHSDALAAFVSQALTWQDWTVTMGLRYEHIQGEFEELKLQRFRQGTQSVVSPGVGVYWQVTEPVGLFAGVHRGFSPAGPGADGVSPEQSVNFETGVRFRQADVRVESIVFLSDYENLLGRCRVSDADCEPGQEFNGGAVAVRGLEFNADWQKSLTTGLDLETKFVYTFTESNFETGFLSGFSQWGLVRENDELPYLPRHRGLLSFQFKTGKFEVGASVKHQSRVREEPGSGPIEAGIYADAYSTLDFTTAWHVRPTTSLQLLVGNVLDENAIVSHRPFGARPNRPRWVNFRVKIQF